MELVHAEENNFKDLIKKDYVLVDFYANWCGPCKMLGPVLEEIKDKIDIIKVDVDICPNIAKEYGVMSIPSLFLIKKGEVIDNKIGFIPKDLLLDWIEDKK